MSNPTELQDSYRTLEIEPGAPLEEVEQAYEALAKTWDPRRFGNDEPRRRKAEKKLRQLNRAYEKLSAELKNGGASAPVAAATAPGFSRITTGLQRHWTERWWSRYLWILALVLAMSYLFIDSFVRQEGIAHTTSISMTNYPLPEKDPKSPTGYTDNQHVQVLPALGTDGQHWTMQTERMLDGREGWRVRHVDYDGVAPVEESSDNKVHLSSSQAEQLLKSGGGAGAQNSGGAESEPEVTGRDVHWSSSLHWVSAGLAWVEHIINHEPIAYSLENTVTWANTFVLGLVMFFLPIAVFRRFGSIATALLAVSFIAVYPYYEFSFVGYFDHHGLAATAELMMVLFMAGAGAGWLRDSTLNPDNLTSVEKALWQWLPERRQAKKWMIASGMAASTGLWVSAASVIPAMFGIGIAALLCTGYMMPERAGRAVEKATSWVVTLCALAGAVFCWGGNSQWGWASAVLGIESAFWGSLVFAVIGGVVGAVCGAMLTKGLLFGSEASGAKMVGKVDPTLWRVWGTSAALTSLFFYLLEYAPSHFSMRLEVNHPLYALALYGAGDILCRGSLLLQSFGQGGRFGETWRQHRRGLFISLALVALLPVTILLFGEKVFVIRPGEFLMNLHQDYILEFRSFLTQLATLSPMQIVGGISLIPLAAVPMILLVFSPDLQRPWKAVLLVVLLPALVMLGLAMFEIRWLGISCAIWCSGLATAALVTTSPGSAYRWREGFRRPLAIFLLLAVMLPFPVNSAVGWITNRDTIGDLDLQQIVTRDVSERLRTRLGHETGVILSGPTTTTWMMYFGGFHGIGSLYWENVRGLETASKIYSAGPSWDDAKALIQKYHVTHIAIFSWDPFADQYARLGAGIRNPKTNQEARDSLYKLRDSFIIKLWDLHYLPPPWLRFIPYQVPVTPALKGDKVMLLEVVPEMSLLESLTRYAQYLMTINDPDAYVGAQEAFDLITKIQDNNHLGIYYPGLIARAQLEQMLVEQEQKQTALAQAGGDADAYKIHADKMSANQAAYKADVQTIVDNLMQAADATFAVEDHVNLALVLYLNNYKAQANAQIQTALAKAAERDLRRLSLERMMFLLQMQAHLPPEMKVPDKTVDFALSLMPPPLQGEILAERAGVVTESNQAQAVELYHQAIKLNPDWEPALTALAKILVLSPNATLRNGQEALDLLGRAAKSAHLQTVENVQLLACASAEVGKFDDALSYANTALMLLEDTNNTADIAEWRGKIQLFENHQAFHLP